MASYFRSHVLSDNDCDVTTHALLLVNLLIFCGKTLRCLVAVNLEKDVEVPKYVLINFP